MTLNGRTPPEGGGALGATPTQFSDPPQDLERLAVAFENLPEQADYPALLSLDSGEPLLIGGALNWISGLPGQGKSQVVLLAARQVLENGGRVAILDFDAPPPRTWLDRALPLGGERLRGLLVDRSRVLLFSGGFIPRRQRERLAAWLAEAPLNMVAVDSAGAAGCPIDGANPAPWIHDHLGAFRAQGNGILVTDHLPKSPALRREARGAVGSGQKLARADISLRLETPKDGGCWGPSVDGRVILTPDKDKLGIYPGGLGKAAAVIRGNWRNGTLGITISAPLPEASRSETEDAIYRALESGEANTGELKQRVRKRARARDAEIVKHAENMAEGGILEKRQEGRGVLWSIRPDGDPEDPPGLMPAQYELVG